jgi:ribosomal protein L11 methyltransferase
MLEGLPPNGAVHVLRLVTDKARATRIVDLVSETFDPAETAASSFEDEQAEGKVKPWLVEIFFAEPPDEDMVRGLVAGASDTETARSATFSDLAETDWVTASLAGLPPVRARRFVVHGAHDRSAVRAHEIGIEIEAALAFGTGHHGTTLGCLKLIASECLRRRPRHILDIGTGTGVLAIATARLLKQRVAAGDIDPVATATARNNAVANAAGAFVRPVTAAGLDHPDLRGGRPYDLVVANILQRPLMRLSAPIGRATTRDARLILSGLLGPDVPGVLAAYRLQGFSLVRRLDHDGWAALLMKRSRHV